MIKQVVSSRQGDLPPSRERSAAFEESFGFCFENRALLCRALTHPSFRHEARGLGEVPDNQTLEFLGDSILGFLVGELLFTSFPAADEGFLSKARSQLVGARHLATLARALGVGRLLNLAVGEDRSGGRERESALADAFEALVAATYLDGGLEAARGVVKRLFEPSVSQLHVSDLVRFDEKSALQERSQAAGYGLPVYRLLEESGPDHEKTFVYEITYPEILRAEGSGRSKKEAQRAAARAALEKLAGYSG